MNQFYEGQKVMYAGQVYTVCYSVNDWVTIIPWDGIECITLTVHKDELKEIKK